MSSRPDLQIGIREVQRLPGRKMEISAWQLQSGAAGIFLSSDFSAGFSFNDFYFLYALV